MYQIFLVLQISWF